VALPPKHIIREIQLGIISLVRDSVVESAFSPLRTGRAMSKGSRSPSLPLSLPPSLPGECWYVGGGGLAVLYPHTFASRKVDTYVRVLVRLGAACILEHLTSVRGAFPIFPPHTRVTGCPPPPNGECVWRGGGGCNFSPALNSFGAVVSTLTVVPYVVVCRIGVPLVHLLRLM